jgi:peroxiredoxin
MADYLPNAQSEFTTWVQLQQRQRAATAVALGLSTDEVEALDAADAAVLVSFATAADQQAKARAAVSQNETDVAAYKKQRR